MYLTNQEIFDKVAKHLITQSAKSINHPDWFCRYRADNGLKCAVGCLIKDEDYRSDIEGQSICQISKVFTNIDIDESIELLRSLQHCHDSFYVTNWKQKLIEIGKFYNLTLPDCLSSSLGE